MRLRNPKARQTDPQMIANLKTYMQNKTNATAAEVRRDIPGFDQITPGVMHQVALDAGFEVELD